MIKLKYFDAVRAAQKNQRPVVDMPPFDIDRLRSKGGLAAWIAGALLGDPRWLLALLRRPGVAA